MAEIKFSQLTTAAQLTNDDIFALAQMQGGSLSSVKTSMIAVANFLNTQVQYTTAYNTQAKTTAGAINELKQLISLIPQFSIEVVQTLPTEDISDATIYLVPAEDPEVGNYYDEYIHVNDSWELVGTTAVDLSAYYTKLEVDGLLATKASVAEVALKENKSDMPTDVRTIIKDCKTPKSATITNGIAQFDCIEENLVKALTVTMNPIQDLHGYSNPWAGGAGKNKLNNTATSQTINGTDFTVNADGSVTIKNTPSATTSLYFGVEEFPAGTYKANGFSGGASNNIRLVYFDITHNVALAGIYQDRDIEFTLSEMSNIRVYPIVPTQYDGNEVTMYPMIRLATETDATFAPYSNICPISGRTEASVTRTVGEDVETKTHQYSETIYGGVDDFVNGGAISAMGMVDLGTLDWQYQTQSGNFYADGGIVNRKAQSNAICSQYVKNNVEVTGVANLTTNNRFAFQASVSTRVIIRDTTYTDAETFKTAMDGVQLCYELATPTTISTSAEEITTVSGTNIISGTEPISECKYTELATVDDLIKIIGGQ